MRIVDSLIEQNSWSTSNCRENRFHDDYSQLFSKQDRKRFTYLEKILIVKYYLESGMNCSLVSQKFFLPYSSVYRIVKAYHDFGVDSFGNNDGSLKQIDNGSLVGNLIKYYWRNQISCYTVKDIAIYLNEFNCVPVKENLVRNHIKQNLNLSFKKASSRPVQLDLKRHRLLKIAFSIEFSHLATPDKLLISLDEVNFSYLTKYNRTWLPKGKSWYVHNIWFKGSRSCIGAITSKGNIFFWWLESTNKSANFISFLSQLKRWIEVDLDYRLKDVILIIDNCPVHKAKKSIKALNEFGSTVLFIPAYSPEYAAIELLFNKLKKAITRQWRKQLIKLDSKDGVRNIREAVAVVSQREIVSYWSNVISQIKLSFKV